jgi:hypothetical protein
LFTASAGTWFSTGCQPPAALIISVTNGRAPFTVSVVLPRRGRSISSGSGATGRADTATQTPAPSSISGTSPSINAVRAARSSTRREKRSR